MDTETLNNLLECAVCWERLDTSNKVLPCQHTFCRKCLEKIVETHKELRCPECRILVSTKIDLLPHNVFVVRLLEGMKVTPKNTVPRDRAEKRPCESSSTSTNPAASSSNADHSAKRPRLLLPSLQSSAQSSMECQQVSPQTPEIGQGRVMIWQGLLEWFEKAPNPTDQKITKHLSCKVSAFVKNGAPELTAESWPSKLIMQVMPKQLIANIGGTHLRNSKTVLFHPQPCEALDSITNIMASGYGGCVHFIRTPNSNSHDVKLLILIYSADKRAYIGFIPNNQDAFINRVRQVIQQSATRQTQPVLRIEDTQPSPNIVIAPPTQQIPSEAVPVERQNHEEEQRKNQLETIRRIKSWLLQGTLEQQDEEPPQQLMLGPQVEPPMPNSNHNRHEGFYGGSYDLPY